MVKLLDVIKRLYKKIQGINVRVSRDYYHHALLRSIPIIVLGTAFAVPKNVYAVSYGAESPVVTCVTTVTLLIAAFALISLLAVVLSTKARKYIVVGATVTSLSLFTSGCATTRDSVLLGAGIGGAMGSGVGMAANQNAGGALIGLGIGAVVGGLMGLAVSEDKKSKEALIKAASKRDISRELPTLDQAEGACTETPEYVRGNKYYGPQIQCVVEKQPSWGVR